MLVNCHIVSTIFRTAWTNDAHIAQESHNSQIYDKQQIQVPYLHAYEFSSYGWDSLRWSMRLLFHCNESKDKWASCTRFSFPHKDNYLSHLLFSSAFHSNDTLLSSCMLIITSRGDLFSWFTRSVKNLICSLSISHTKSLPSWARLLSWMLEISQESGPIWPT